MRDQSATERVLFVCSANQCRSPMAELIARSKPAALGLDVSFGSAGTSAHDGVPIHPYAAFALAKRGIRSNSFLSSELTDDHLAESDLILTADESHLRAVLLRAPDAREKSFLLLDFANLVSVCGESQPSPSRQPVRSLSEVARASRPYAPRLAVREVTDPIGMPRREFRRCASRLDEAVTLVVDALVRITR